MITAIFPKGGKFKKGEILPNLRLLRSVWSWLGEEFPLPLGLGAQDKDPRGL